VYHTTGFSKDEIVELCALVHATGISSGGDGYPTMLSLFKSVVVTLTYLRRNHVQQELAEYYGVSQSTISRAITAITPELARVMRPFTPTAQELLSDEQMIVDGTLVSCWSWDGHPELHSGKHHTTGLNLQVVCDLAGRLRWISNPVEGCRHDSAALRGSGATWTGLIPKTGSATNATSASACSLLSENHRTANFSTEKRTSTPPSTKSAGESNQRSRT
jgi:hypothetical protein